MKLHDKRAFMANMGRNVRAAREGKGMKQWQLAAAAVMPQTTVSDIELGRRMPNAMEVIQLAHALGVGITTLYRKEDDHADQG